MNVPFLVKQYLSNDLEQGSYSKIFWYYPLQKEQQERGGIGLYFEVLYGDVDYEIYEQISKRFWDTFSDYFYLTDFEESLRKAIQVFTQLLRGFGVEEGLDVNIVLFNAKQVGKGYQLKIISFGEADIFVIRDQKVADISELTPQNKSLRDVKFLELDLEENDVLLLSNKTLLKNAFDSDIIVLDSVEKVLESMAQFKENLFGSKKVFLIAAYSNGAQSIEKTAISSDEKSSFIQTITEKMKGLPGVVTGFAQSLKERISPSATEKLPKQESADQKELDEILKTPTVITESDIEDKVEETNDEEADPIIESEKLAAENSAKDDPLDEEPELMPYKVPQVPVKRPQNYAEEFRSSRSPLKKALSNSRFGELKSRFSGLAKYTEPILEKIREVRFPMKKIFVGQHAKTGRPVIQWGRIAIVVGILFLGIIYIRGRIIETNNEADALSKYKATVNQLQTYYNQSIVNIQQTDENNELDRCFDKINETKATLGTIDITLVKTDKGKSDISAENGKLTTIENVCTTKYDEVNGIERIKDASIVTDFKVKLGNDSNPVDMALGKGLIYVADAGRKAIYQVNPANNNVIKLEDPQALIKDPISIGAGEDVIFVCDRQSGVVYFEDNNQGFKRIVGLEPASIGTCSIVKGFGKNVYVVPESGDRLIRAVRKGDNYEAPTRYIDGLAEIKDLVIDGNIYFVTTGTGKSEVWKYYGGKRDAFALDETIELTDPTSAYTNPSDSFSIYILDKSAKKVIAIEKATAQNHPGIGILKKSIVLQNEEKFGNIKDISVNLVDGRETILYVLNGSSVWSVNLPRE